MTTSSPLADYFCRTARERIVAHFAGLHHNSDLPDYSLTQAIRAARLERLETGILNANRSAGSPPASPSSHEPRPF